MARIERFEDLEIWQLARRLNKEIYELMKTGANVIVLGDPSGVGDFVPDFGVLNGPYLLKEPGDHLLQYFAPKEGKSKGGKK